jgi:hypothetical protein
VFNFVKQFIPSDQFNIIYASDIVCEHGVAAVDDDNNIYINKEYFNKYEDIEQRCVLLHEIGHLICEEVKSPAENEYRAHMVAIDLAKSMKLTKEVLVLDDAIRNWPNYTWNEDKGIWRSHIKAGRKYIKRYGNRKKRLCK